MQVERHEFYKPERILRDVKDKVERAAVAGEPADYLAFVPDGEPTLDLNLDPEIELLGALGIRIAVITNGSLIWHEDVRNALMKADWVSLKVDSAEASVWRQIARPHGNLQFATIVRGAHAFAKSYGGELVTETMLIEGVNDGSEHLSRVARLLSQLQPSIAYLAVPTRPPAEAWVRPPGEAVINQAYQIFSETVDRVELLIGYEGNAFAFTGNVEEDLLSITAVHPMRQDAVDELLARAGATWPVVRKLVAEGQLVETAYRGQTFYLRNL
jgi:wyosine [tRNA(Phe)-imidazoG37] synthetase (radical SAM superfamily)